MPRSALVDRLKSADIFAVPPVTPMPVLTNRSAPSGPSSVRTFTTTKARPFPPKDAVGSEPPKQPVEPEHHEHVSSTGPDVVSHRTEAAKGGTVTPEETTVAPGLPRTKEAGSKTEGLNVKMPVPPMESEAEQVIVSLSVSHRFDAEQLSASHSFRTTTDRTNPSPPLRPDPPKNPPCRKSSPSLRPPPIPLAVLYTQSTLNPTPTVTKPPPRNLHLHPSLPLELRSITSLALRAVHGRLLV